MKKIILTSFLLLNIQTPSQVLAHGEASWIMRAYPYCCGEKDCIKIENVVPVDGGYMFESPLEPGKIIIVPEEEARPSHDHHWWACFNLETKEVRCFFKLEMGA